MDRGSTDVQYGDVSVLFGKAQVLFDLGDYPQAAQRFGRLLEDRKLGAAWIAGEKGGQPANQENPQYWEAMYKLYRSNLQLTHDPAVPNSEQLRGETAKGLRRFYIREGGAVGGTKWRERFEALRKELIPDFQATPAK